MDRRSFLLGTLAGGIGFYTTELNIDKVKLLNRQTLDDRLLRLYKAGYGILQKCKLYYVNADGTWEMPGMQQVILKSRGIIEFKAHELKITKASIFNGLTFVDDEDYIIKKDIPFDQTVHVIPNDTLIATYTLNILINNR